MAYLFVPCCMLACLVMHYMQSWGTSPVLLHTLLNSNDHNNASLGIKVCTITPYSTSSHVHIILPSRQK